MATIIIVIIIIFICAVAAEAFSASGFAFDNDNDNDDDNDIVTSNDDKPTPKENGEISWAVKNDETQKFNPHAPISKRVKTILL
jgi:hypothetical protein